MKNEEISEKLNLERRKIDDIDNIIINFLDMRLEIVKSIGKIKKQNNLKIFNQERELEVLKKAENKRNTESIKNILKKIMDESKNLQEELKF